MVWQEAPATMPDATVAEKEALGVRKPLGKTVGKEVEGALRKNEGVENLPNKHGKAAKPPRKRKGNEADAGAGTGKTQGKTQGKAPGKASSKAPGKSQGERNRELGRRGEDAAARFLERRGYDIVARNWTCFAGEADIIARDGASVVFVEVKTRSSYAKGLPGEAVGKGKRERYEKIAAAFLSEYEVVDVPLRFDVVSIVLVAPDRAMIRHHIDAFGAG